MIDFSWMGHSVELSGSPDHRSNRKNDLVAIIISVFSQTRVLILFWRISLFIKIKMFFAFSLIRYNIDALMSKKCHAWTPNGSGAGLGALGRDLGTKNLPTVVLADFDQFWPGSDRPKSRPHGPRRRQVGAKMALRWAKLEPRSPSWGHLGSYLDHFWWSWERHLRKWRKSKIER